MKETNLTDITVKYLTEGKSKLYERDLWDIENYWSDIFDIVRDSADDRECLMIGIRVLEHARDRLDGDLENNEIEAEYNKLAKIINDLYDILDNYV